MMAKVWRFFRVHKVVEVRKATLLAVTAGAALSLSLGQAHAYDLKAQIQILRRQGVLKEYDQANRETTPAGRTKALRDFITETSKQRLSGTSYRPKITVANSEQYTSDDALETLKTFQTNVRRSFQETRQQVTLIWRGEKAKKNEYPETVMLGSHGQPGCTGTLISTQMVLTAAHCFCDELDEVTFGQSQTSSTQKVGVDRAASKTKIACDRLYPEKNYEKNINTGDIALLKLKKPVSGVAIRKIATEEQFRASKTVLAVGFGITESNPEAGEKFAVTITIASYDCSDRKQGPYLCAAGLELYAAGLRKDTCEGDSGGPVYVTGKDSMYYQVGVTSRAVSLDSECGEGGIYVKLTSASNKNWLIENGVPKSAFAQ